MKRGWIGVVLGDADLRVVGYDRSWIEWGNRDDLPIAQASVRK
jgi:3-mercaptopyruvate sulfurtransferase SseA